MSQRKELYSLIKSRIFQQAGPRIGQQHTISHDDPEIQQYRYLNFTTVMESLHDEGYITFDPVGADDVTEKSYRYRVALKAFLERENDVNGYYSQILIQLLIVMKNYHGGQQMRDFTSEKFLREFSKRISREPPLSHFSQLLPFSLFGNNYFHPDFLKHLYNNSIPKYKDVRDWILPEGFKLLNFYQNTNRKTNKILREDVFWICEECGIENPRISKKCRECGCTIRDF